MKWNIFSVLLSILMTVFAAPSALASTPTPTPSGSSVVEIRNNVPNKIVITEPNPDTVGLSPTPGVEYHYSVPPLDPNVGDFKVPALDAIADWLMRSTPYMTAKFIKETTIPHQPDNMVITGRIKRCITIGNLKFEQKGQYETEPVSYLPTLFTANNLLAPHLTRYTISPVAGSYDFRGPSYKLIDSDLPCDITAEGESQMPKALKPATGTSLPNFLQVLGELVKFKIITVSNQLTPTAEWIHCIMNNCVKTGADLAYVQDAKKEESIQKSGGIVDAGFRTVQMDMTKGKPVHGKEENFLTTNTAYTKQMENSADLIRCSLVPAAQRAKIGLKDNSKCAGFVNPTDSQTDKDVCAIANTYHIPCCQLKGVMELETGSGAYMGNDTCTRGGQTFSCCHGAVCGPAQIACNQYDAFAGGEKIDMCTKEGAAILLARAMLLKLCQADQKCDSYNWSEEKSYVMDHYKVADGDYTATAYFYGLSHGCVATACSQYRWGAGKGYCDSVKSYCDTGQVLPDKKSPEFCEKCNEELIRAKQNPIDCTK